MKGLGWWNRTGWRWQLAVHKKANKRGWLESCPARAGASRSISERRRAMCPVPANRILAEAFECISPQALLSSCGWEGREQSNLGIYILQMGRALFLLTWLFEKHFLMKSTLTWTGYAKDKYVFIFPPPPHFCFSLRICIQCRRCKRYRFDPWVGKIPWSRKWQPTPVFLLGKLHGQRSLAGYSPRVAKSHTWLSEQLTCSLIITAV